MSSVFRERMFLMGIAWAAVATAAAAQTSSAIVNTGEESPRVSQSDISPGQTKPVRDTSARGQAYMKDSGKIAEGQRLYKAMNCVGCHAGGGGGMGPPLMDQKWIYGGEIENIAASIREGRPNGMPSWRGKIPEDEIWKLAAYVHALGSPGSQQNQQAQQEP